MPFSFFNPWLLLGALAVAAPVWLHLRRKRETDVVPFSALRFLDDQPEPRRSPLRLRDLLLFALRVLAVLAVVGGFAWPYLRGANTAPIRESRVYVFDNTLSRQADGGFATDRARLLADLDKVDAGTQVAAVELRATPRLLFSFGENRDVARQKVKDLRPSFERGAYLPAFRQANSLLANSLGAARKIVLLGDNQANQWSESISTPPFLRDMEVELPKAGVAAKPNLWLSEPRVQRIFLGEKSLVNFTVKLGHAGEARTANIALKANDKVIFNRAVPLEKQPESILLQAEWEADPAEWLRGDVAVEGSPDALAADNRVFFSLAPVVEGHVALLAQSSYLRLALSSDIMRGQWSTRILEPAKLGDEISAGKDADVLVIESNYLQSGDARRLLWRYLTGGRGVVLLMNRVTPAIEGFVRELGFETDGTFSAEKGKPDRLQYVLSNHPIFHPFLSSDYGNLMEIGMTRYVRLKASQAMPLVFSERGVPLFFQGTRTQGKLFVAAFGLDRSQTSWPVHQTFIPFLDLMLQAARAEDPTPTTFEPGEVCVLQLPAGAEAHTAVLRDDKAVLASAPVEQGKSQLRMPAEPGLYTVTYDAGKRVEKVFSVNPPPKESLLAFDDHPEALKAWTMNLPADNAKPLPAGAGKPMASSILQQRLWWWMVLAGLAALFVEMGLSALKQNTA
jgi:hypothetical protein